MLTTQTLYRRTPMHAYNHVLDAQLRLTPIRNHLNSVPPEKHQKSGLLRHQKRTTLQSHLKLTARIAIKGTQRHDLSAYVCICSNKPRFFRVPSYIKHAHTHTHTRLSRPQTREWTEQNWARRARVHSGGVHSGAATPLAVMGWLWARRRRLPDMCYC